MDVQERVQRQRRQRLHREQDEENESGRIGQPLVSKRPPGAGNATPVAPCRLFSVGIGHIDEGSEWHDACVSIVVRPAEMGDEGALTRIEQETWLPHVSPSAYRSRPFFENVPPEEVLVGVLDGEVAGYLCLRPPTPLASNAHVLMVTGLGVSPSAQRRGVASGLLEAAETYRPSAR